MSAKKLSWALVPALLIGAAACSDVQNDPASPFAAQFNKNVDAGKICPDGDSGKIATTDDPQSVTITADPGYVISQYCVKAGQDMAVITVNPQTQSVTFSAPNGKAVSHYSFWQVLTIFEVNPWCSPGYWRQEHHHDEWPVSLGTLFNAVIDPDVAGNPTLLEVLNSPQTYGGAAFNAVGTYLSTQKFGVAPTLDANGDPYHNCPLN